MLSLRITCCFRWLCFLFSGVIVYLELRMSNQRSNFSTKLVVSNASSCRVPFRMVNCVYSPVQQYLNPVRLFPTCVISPERHGFFSVKVLCDMEYLPAATEWEKTWVASFTLILVNGGRLRCLSVSLGAIRMVFFLSFV